MSRRSYSKPVASRKHHQGRQPRKVAPQADRSVQLPLCRDELVAMMQNSLATFATELGLRLAFHMRKAR